MSFGTYARRVRDVESPYGMRYRSLRCAVSRYCPIGFHATWSFLGTVGNLKCDEQALLRALDLLETSRAARLAELEAFAARRSAEKRQRHQRTPSASDRRRLFGYRWPGPDSRAAVLHTVGPLWEAHIAEPLPETPSGTESDFAYLDSTITECVSIYLAQGGELDRGHRRILTACLDTRRERLSSVGYSTDYHTAFRYFQRLYKLAALVVGSEPTSPQP